MCICTCVGGVSGVCVVHVYDKKICVEVLEPG